MSLFTIFEGERSIYDVIETARFPEDMVEGYDYCPVIGKTSIWTPLGDILSSLEKFTENRIDGDKYYTIRLDGHAFSKKMPKLKALKVFQDEGYSLEFEAIMKLVASTLLSTVQNAIYAFTQSDEVIVLVRACDRDSIGNFTNFEFQRRRDKLVSIYASLATNVFTKEIMKLVFLKQQSTPEWTFDWDAMPDIQFDARIAAFNSLAEAFQMILWRSYDCSVNGISSGLVFRNGLHNKKNLLTLNSTEKLIFLAEQGFLAEMTRHQLYGTFFFHETYEMTLSDGRVKNKRRVVSFSDQILKRVKEDTFPVPYR